MQTSVFQRANQMLDKALKHAQHDQSSHGRGGGGGGAVAGRVGGAGGTYDGSVGYGGDSGDGISVAKNGQLKVKKPKNPTESMAQLKRMEKIFEKAEKDVEASKTLPSGDRRRGMAELRLRHVAQQFQRTMGYAKKLT